jgi:hypothetical protein
MTTFNTAIETITSSMPCEEAWAYKLTREEWLEFNSMTAELGFAAIEQGCECLVDNDEEGNTEFEMMYAETLHLGKLTTGEAWGIQLTPEEFVLFNDNVDLEVVELPLPSTMSVGEALASCDWDDDNTSDKGNVILPFAWEPEIKALRACALEDLTSCMLAVKLEKMEMKV